MPAPVVVKSPQPSREETTMPKHWTYGRIADDLTARIRRGEWPPGAQIPTYEQLGERYSVHKTTAARAVALLRERELVEGAPGRGVFVREGTKEGPS
jgi:DNA-binding GntR family transcriptional regulator